MTAPDKTRYPEIDMLKGLACILMLIGHAVRVHMPPPGDIDKIVLYIMDFSGPIFFFVSGMNVMTFVQRNADKPGFAATKFYMAAAVLLFFLGFTYNINRASLAMDIFQGVAMCTIVVYLLMRTKLPTVVHFAIMAAAYGVYVWFRVRLQLDLVLPDFTELKTAIPSGADITHPAVMPSMMKLLSGLGPLRVFFFVHFSILPWVVFFYMGALCYRSLVMKRGATWPWWLLFALLFAAGPGVHFADGGRVFRQFFLDSYLDLMLRGIPSYVLITLGGAGLSYLIANKVYRGAAAYSNRVVKWLWFQVERLGKESLMFLVVHWWVISTLMLFIKMHDWAASRQGKAQWDMEVYPRAVLTILLVMLLVPLLAKMRDRMTARSSSFGVKVGIFMAGSIVLALLLIVPAPPLAHFATYGSSLGFAFLYPYLRGKLRKRYTKKSVAPEPVASA